MINSRHIGNLGDSLLRWLATLALCLCTVGPAQAAVDAIWAGGQKGVFKIDPVSGDKLLTIDTGEDVVALEVDDLRYRVWVLSEDGQLQQYNFDGTLLFTVMLPPNSEGESEIEHSAMQLVPADGSLWVVAKEMLLKYALDGSLLLQTNLPDEVNGLALDEAGDNLWVGAEEVLLRYASDGTQNGSINLGGEDNEVKDIAFNQAQDNLWVVIKDNLARYDASNQLIASIYLKKIKQVELDTDGNLWAATKKLLYRFDPQGGGQTLVPRSDDKKIDDFVVDSDDNSVWVVSHHKLAHISQTGQLLSEFNIKHVRVPAVAHVDSVPPELSLTAPVADALVVPQPAIVVSYSDLGIGVDSASLAITVNGVAVAMTCSSDSSGASCTPDQPFTVATLNLSATVADLAGNVSAAATVQVKLDTDQDGVPDDLDAFPSDPNESSDLDGDGIGDNADPDRDGDGFSNDVELQVGTDPNDAASVPPDLDGDFIPDSLDDDRDGDGVLNTADLYPDDATRFRLAAVAGVAPALQNTQVRIAWQAVADVANLAGYNLYRLPASGGTPALLNSAPVSALNFVDAGVANGNGYRYRVVALDINGNEGDPGTNVPLFVAYNNTPVSNLQALRNNAVPVSLSWDAASGFRYQLYRAAPGGTPAQLGTATTNNYIDTAVVWQQGYRYQIATLADFTDPFTSQPISIVGPRSTSVEVAALPQLTLAIDDAVVAADGVSELILGAQTRLSITGRYANALGPVDIVADNGTQPVTGSASDGAIRIVLPVGGNASWTLRVTEQAIGDRTAVLTVRLVADTTPPVVSIDGGANRSIDADSILISGTAADPRSGLARLSLANDRFPGQPFGAVLGAAGRFSAELPLKAGTNVLTVSALDGAGNAASAQVTVERSIGLAPTMSLAAPINGATVSGERISVQGTVYTGLPAEQVRISLGDRSQFPTTASTPGAWPFSFSDVRLVEGPNSLTVQVATPAGNAQAAVFVTYDPNPSSEPTPPPQLTLSAPINTAISTDNITLAGSVVSFAGAVSLTLEGAPVALTGPDDTQGNFQQVVNVTALGNPATLTLVATDAAGNSTTRRLTLTRDSGAPVISITSPGVQTAPAVTSVFEVPFPLTGSVVDAGLTGVSINGQPVGVVPGAVPDSFEFDASVELPAGVDQPVTIEAWDRAGNRSSLDIILNATPTTDIEIVSPRAGAELALDAASTVAVVARLSGLGAGDTAWAGAGAAAPAPMTLDAGTARVSLPVANAGALEIRVQVQNSVGDVTAQRRVSVTLIDDAAVALAVARREPANAATGIEPNTFIALYFNKPVDPARLQISVKETAHGLTWDLTGQQGASPITDSDTFQLVQVDYDQQPVAGGLSTLPGGRSVAFYPARDFVYGASVFIDVSVDGQELDRFSFQLRPLPTLVQGFVADSMLQPLAGIEVSLPDLERRAVTDRQGSFSFGFGEPADRALPGGRQRLIINPGLKDPRYGTLETWANLEAGRLTRLELNAIPILNPNEPFRRIAGGQAQALLAGGDLQLNLSSADLLFPDGARAGNIHVQLLQRSLVPFGARPSVAPPWLFAVQPSGVQVRGDFTATLAMPSLYGSFDYLPPDGTRVLMVGFDSDSKQLIPIGVGRVARQRVKTVGTLRADSLDYIGYALKDAAAQAVLRDYETGALSFEQMGAELDRLAN